MTRCNMFKIGDKVIVRIVWSQVIAPHIEYAKEIDGHIGEIFGAFKEYIKQNKDRCKGFAVSLLNVEGISIVEPIHLIKIDDDDATPDKKVAWKENDLWNPNKIKINA